MKSRTNIYDLLALGLLVFFIITVVLAALGHAPK